MIYTYLSRVLGAAFIASAFVLLCAPLLDAQASKGDLQDVRAVKSGPLIVTLGKAELVDVVGDVSDVLVADPSVVDVQAVQSNRLYIVGTSIGDTNIIALDARGDVIRKIDIHVTYDLQAIQTLVDDLFPGESVKVGSVHDQVLLTGQVSTPIVASKVTSLVGHYVGDLQDSRRSADELVANLLEVRGRQQVMLQVKIIEATRSVLKELGLKASAGGGDSFTFDTTGGGIALTKAAAGIGTVFANTGLNALGLFSLELDALEEENLVNVLAEPNLTAISGEQAGFLAGGEFPVPVGRDQVGNLVIEFREFGVSLNFRPTVLSSKRISLQLDTEVSSLDFDNAITLSDVQVPGLDVRRTETTVEIASGGSLMIAGLLKSDAVESMAGLPGIRNTPILGDLVSSRGFQREETELLVIVTPYLVEPYAETDRAEKPILPPHKSRKLAEAFAANMRRVFDPDDESLFISDEPFGYILD